MYDSTIKMYCFDLELTVLEPVKTVVLEINTTIHQTVRFSETKRISNSAAAQLWK